MFMYSKLCYCNVLMTFHVQLIVILWLLFKSSSLAASITLLQPQPTVYVARDGIKADITLAYTITSHETHHISSYDFCLILKSLSSNREFSEKCVNITQDTIELREIEVGNYHLSTYLREMYNLKGVIAGSLNIVEFGVVSLSSVLPEIKITQGLGTVAKDQLMQALVDNKTGLGSLVFEYKLKPKRNSIISFQICLSVDAGSESILSDTCLDALHDTVTVQGLQQTGQYSLRVGVRETKGKDDKLTNIAFSTTIPETICEFPVAVVELHSVVPHIRLLPAEAALNFVADAISGEVLEVNVHIAIEGLLSAVAMVAPCLELQRRSSSNDDIVVALTCLLPDQRTFLLRHLPAGVYTLIISLRSLATDAVLEDGSLLTTIRSRSLYIPLEARRLEEFWPSYDWQALKPWHTIPAGLETRLPIGDTGMARKEARIPQPWRLQVALPAPPCRRYSFLRMDLYRTSLMQHIRSAVAKQCNVLEECVQVLSNGVASDVTASVERVGFFHSKHIIHVQPNCPLL